MTKQQISMLIERARDWPEEAQEELVRRSIDIEQRSGLMYRLSNDERADIREGLAEIGQNEAASAAKVEGTFKRLRRS